MGDDEVDVYKNIEELAEDLFQPERAVAVEATISGVQNATIHFEMKLQQTNGQSVTITGTLDQSVVDSGARGRSVPLAIEGYRTGVEKEKKWGFNRYCTYGNDNDEPIEMSREVHSLASIEDEEDLREAYKEAIETALEKRPSLRQKDQKLSERVCKKLDNPKARLSAGMFKKSTPRDEAALKCAKLVSNGALVKPNKNAKEKAQKLPPTTAAFYEKAQAQAQGGVRKEGFSFENPKRTRAKEGAKTAELSQGTDEVMGVNPMYQMHQKSKDKANSNAATAALFEEKEQEGEMSVQNPLFEMRETQVRAMPIPPEVAARLPVGGVGESNQQTTPSPPLSERESKREEGVKSPGSSTAGALGVPGGIVGKGQEALAGDSSPKVDVGVGESKQQSPPRSRSPRR